MDWTETPHPPDLCPAPMQQHGAYGRACTRIGSRVIWMTAGAPALPAAFAQVLIRRWPGFGDFALVARGPVFTAPVSRAEAGRITLDLVQELRRRCRGVMVTPEPGGEDDPLTGSGLLPMVTGGAQARLMLDGTAAERMARQNGKWRNRLRRAEEAGLTVEQGPLPEDPSHWLLLAEEAQAAARGYRRLPRSFTYAWRAANGARATRVFTATLRGERVAAMLFLLHGDTASYHLGWSNSGGRDSHAHNLLLWRASDWLARRGHVWLDLGTLDTETTPGLARFKLGSGAVPVRMGATWMEAPGTALVARLFRAGPRRLPAGLPSPG